MLRGYYTLTSGMLTQERKLDTIGNNMANASTPGFKQDTMTATTFRDVLASRVGSVDKNGSVNLGNVSMILTPDEAITNFEQGSIDQTERELDFALSGKGFFTVQRPDGSLVYTRNGSFTLDDNGNLSLQHVGQVLGDNGPIQLGTDRVSVDESGQIRAENGSVIGALRIVDFTDYGTLVKTGEGMFQNPNAQNVIGMDASTKVLDKSLERSNVVSMNEMVSMMTSQRALQSAGQVIKIYDQIMAKAVTELGRL